MTIDDLLIELEESERRFWFIQRSEIERIEKEGKCLRRWPGKR